MFGCLGRLLSAIALILLGAFLHAQWPSITRQLRERIPDLLPAPVAEKARTIVEGDRTVDRSTDSVVSVRWVG